MTWADRTAPRISRGAVGEVSKRLFDLIEAAETALQRHQSDHDGPPCLACELARERIERARECF